MPPTGWVQVARHNFGTDIGQAIYRKTAHNSEPSSYTWTFRKGTSLESVRASGGIVRYTGVDTSNPIVGTATGASGDKNSLTAPSVAANADLVDSMLLAYFGVKKKTTLTLPSGMTAQYTPQPPGTQQHSNGSGPTIRADKQLLATAAAPGNKTSTAGDIDKWVGQQVALRAEAEDATVSGQKLDDADNGLEDWEINAFADDGDGTLDADEASAGPVESTTTDADGDYELTLEAGDYVICEVQQSGWEQVAPGGDACEEADSDAPGGHPVTLAAGQDEPGLDFENAEEEVAACPFNQASGILAPIASNNGKVSMFKTGSTIPVKVRILDCDGLAVPGLAPTVSLKRLDGSPESGAAEVVSTSKADTGNVMRFSDGQYIYNLSAKKSTYFFPNGDPAPGTYEVKVNHGSLASPVKATFDMKK